MILARQIQKYHITFYLFLLVIVTLSFSRKIFIISLWPWILSWLFEGDFRVKLNKERYHKGVLSIRMLFLLFAMYSFSLLWSDNLVYGFTNLGEQACLVLIPFFMVFSFDQITDRNNFKLILKAFIVGLVISSAYLIMVAFSRSLSFNNGALSFDPVTNEWENVFFNYQFSFLIHPSYYAMMLLMAITICIRDIQTNLLFKKSKLVPVFLIIYFGAIVLLTQSRAAFIGLLAIAIYQLISSRIMISKKIVIFLFIIVTSVAYIGSASRFQYFKKDNTKSTVSNISAFLKANIRKDIWSSSLVVIKENPIFGVGLGDEQDELDKIYKSDNQSQAFAEHLNCHNQFLQTWLSTGIVGLLILIFSLVVPLIRSEILSKPDYFSFLIIITAMFFFESMFDRVWGVAFYSIFYTLLTIKNVPGSVTEINNNVNE